MLTFLGRKFRFLLVVVLFVIGISFIFFGSWTPRGDGVSTQTLGTIEGREVRYDDFVAAQRTALIMNAFRTGQFAERGERDENSTEQAWLHLIALAAAKESNLRISDQEIVSSIQTNPLFQEKGKYSPELFQKFFQYYLTPQGVTLERFQEMIKDELTINRLLSQISSAAVINPAEVDDMFNRLFGKVEISMVTFPLSQIRQSIKPTPEELDAFYKKHSASYMNPEKRKVEFIEFKLTDAEKKLSDVEKSKALSKLGEKVFEFLGNFTSEPTQANFKDMAAKYGFPVQTSDFVSQDQNFLPQYKQPDLIRVAFDLTTENPVSDYVALENGYLVFRLLEIQPSQPIPFKDAQKQVQEDFVHQRSIELLQEQTAAFSKEIKQQLSSGATWEKAVANLKQKAVNAPAFIPADSSELKIEAAQIVRAWTQKLAVGQVSDFISTPTGGMILFLKNRQAPSEEKRKEVWSKIQSALLQQRQSQLIQEWFSSRLLRPKTHLPDKLLQNLEN